MSAERRVSSNFGVKVKRGINEHGGDSQLEGLQLDLRFRKPAAAVSHVTCTINPVCANPSTTTTVIAAATLRCIACRTDVAVA